MEWRQRTIEKITYISYQSQIKALLNHAKYKKIAIWGAGVRGILTGIILEDLRVKDFIFIDSDVKRQGSRLNGHLIEPFAKVNINEYYIILSMEYQDSTKNKLLELGLKEGRDFVGLYSYSYDEMINELKQNLHNATLIVGSSNIHIMPLEERMQEDLAEIIKKKYSNCIKILGSTCLGMRNMYYLIRTEMYRNPNLKNVVILVNWETLTSYHDDLPRTQKPQLIKSLQEYVHCLGGEQLAMELAKEWELAIEKAEDYGLENAYSPSRLDSNKESSEALKKYLQLSVMEDLCFDCGEILFLTKILKELSKESVNVDLVIEPMNMELGKELCGDDFEKVCGQKYAFIENLAKEYGVSCYNATDLLDSKQYVAINMVSEALYSEGRNKFADYIIQIIESR